MKNSKKIRLFILLLSLLSTVPNVHATGSLRVGDRLRGPGRSQLVLNEVQNCNRDSSKTIENTEMETSGITKYSESKALSCRSTQTIESLFELSTVSVAALGWILACTGAGAPLTLALEVTASRMGVVSAVIHNIPCEDRDSQRDAQTRTLENLCAMLRGQGILCDPSKVEVRQLP